MVRVMIKVLGGFDFGCDNGSNHCGGNISVGDGCGAQTLKMSDPSSPLRVALAPRLSGRVALWGRFWRWRCEGRRPPLLSSSPLGSGQPIFLGMQRRCCTHHNRSMPLKSDFSAEKCPLFVPADSDCMIDPVHPFDVKRLFPLSLILKLELILAFLSCTYCGVDRNPHVSRKSICLTDKTIDCHVCCIITSQLLPCLIVL